MAKEPDQLLNITVVTPWVTSLFECVNPEHGSIKPGLTEYFYRYEAEKNVRIESGVAPDIKTNLFESTFLLFQQEEPVVQALKLFCAHSVLEVAKHVNGPSWGPDVQFSVQFRESWFHITRDGGFHDIHNHGNCSWCGIYYVDIGEATKSNGANAFFDPRTAAHGYVDFGTEYLENTHRFDVVPEDGKLVVFPSYLYHSATPYRGNRDRIVVSFNASIRRETS